VILNCSASAFREFYLELLDLTRARPKINPKNTSELTVKETYFEITNDAGK